MFSYRHPALILATSCLVLSSCNEASDIDIVEIDAVASVSGQAILDSNGTGSIDGGDAPIASITIRLLPTSGNRIIQEAVTDSAGLFLFQGIPVGSYRLGIDPAVLGDSLETVGEAENPITLVLGEATQLDFLLSHPFLTIEEVREADEGRLVFTSGIALNPRLNFGDGVVHLQGELEFLRLLNVERANIGTGDSLRVLGRTATDNGQPVLDGVTPFVLVNFAAIPIPMELSTGAAATAEGGDADAALVRIREAEISDTITIDNDFHFTVDDGSGPLEVVLRSFLQINTVLVLPDTVVRVLEASGLLWPFADETGSVRWRLLPRGGAEVTLEIKTADVGVGVIVDDPTASQGDQRTFTVTVTNSGPRTATGVTVADTIPEGLTFVSSEASVGSYNSITGAWLIGDMEVGATETLTITMEVTTDLVGTVVNAAFLEPLEREVDPNPQNNAAGAPLTIVAAAPGV